MRVILLLAGVGIGWTAAWLSARSKAQLLADRYFVKGWAARCQSEDERNPEVRA